MPTTTLPPSPSSSTRRERPLLLKDRLVRATLVDMKTQTRRVDRRFQKRGIKGSACYVGTEVGGTPGEWLFDDGTDDGVILACPYGAPGDVLWVREAYRANMNGPGRYEYRADQENPAKGWIPGIHMPRDACRLRLLVEEVRVERLQLITEEDAVAEGVKTDEHGMIGEHGSGYPSARMAFASLWDSINEERGYGWDTNPLVWCVSFKRLPNPLTLETL